MCMEKLGGRKKVQAARRIDREERVYAGVKKEELYFISSTNVCMYVSMYVYVFFFQKKREL